MELPLLKRATETGETFLFTNHPASACSDSDCACTEPPVEGLIPLRVPGPGEQYRFHFDMTKCIGCKCCVVACNEQNGNPADINWRRVGDIEGGSYPDTMRNYLSMGCNHCVEPTCLRVARLAHTPRNHPPASCCTAPSNASGASTASGTAPMACRNSIRSAG